MKYLPSFKSIVSLVVFMISCCLAYSQCDVLVWSDEFNATGAPNSAFWGFDLGQSGWGNNEIQNYTSGSSNIRQENGMLIIEAVKSGNSWTSARLKSQGKINFKYGKIVFRAKLPSGSGTWPALWMLGESISSVGWPACGEIDVMEHVGKAPGVIHSTIHTPSSYGNSVNTAVRTINDYNSAFHEYAVSWNQDRMVFSIDGIPHYTYNPPTKNSSTWPFDANQFIIMNVAMGGNFGSDPQYETNGLKNGIDPAISSARMEVDYVRVYEERSEPLITGPLFVPEQQQNIAFEAPDYGLGVTYNWTVPVDAQIVTGQGTNKITVNWGVSEGLITLDLTGNTGCTSNSTSIEVGTTIQPQGDKYLVDDFSDNATIGWSSSGSASEIVISENNSRLEVTYNVPGLNHIQYEFPKAVDLSDFSLIKIPIAVTSSVNTPNLIATLIDGNGNETSATTFDIDISKKDGEFHNYSFEFTDLWDDNTPAVDSKQIKVLRIYILNGDSQFYVDDIFFFNILSLPDSPSGLNTVSISGNQFELSWFDISNASSFHVYRKSESAVDFERFRSNVRASEIPLLITQNDNVVQYRITGVNSTGESLPSDVIEFVSTITGILEMDDNFWVYPNPSAGSFTIYSSSGLVEDIGVVDGKGLEIPFKLYARADATSTLTLMQEAPGLYIIRFRIANKVIHQKILIK